MPEARFTSRPFEISPVDFTRPVPSRPVPPFLPSVPGPTFPPLNQPERSPLYRRNKVNDTRFQNSPPKTIHRFPILDISELPTFFSRLRPRKTRQLGWSREVIVISAPILPSFPVSREKRRKINATRLPRGREEKLARFSAKKKKNNVALGACLPPLSPFSAPLFVRSRKRRRRRRRESGTDGRTITRAEFGKWGREEKSKLAKSQPPFLLLLGRSSGSTRLQRASNRDSWTSTKSAAAAS